MRRKKSKDPSRVSMKSVIILKSRGNQLFFAMLYAKTSYISSCLPGHSLPYEDYIVHGHPKDQRDECEHIKGTLNLCFSRLIIVTKKPCSQNVKVLGGC